MFVITELEDTVEIRAASEDKAAAVAEQLRLKYCGRLVNELGLAVHLHGVVEIREYVMKNAILEADAVFQVLFYRFYPNEVCTGKILHQNEDGIVIGDGLFRRYIVRQEDLFENCELDADGASPSWVWNYKSSRLVFYTGDRVRFRIKKTRFEDSSVDVCINEQGLGPVAWWD